MTTLCAHEPGNVMQDELSRIPNKNHSHQNIDQTASEGIRPPASPLKHPRLLQLLCSPDGSGEKPLHISGNELIGAGWRVPIINGIPDFVTYAPKITRSLEISIPDDAMPDPGILKPPPNCEAIPAWYQQAFFKFPLLQSHKKGFLLDVGAGQGKRRSFESFGYEYVSLDISFNSGQTCKGDADIDVVADCHRLPIRSSRVEVVDCTAVIEHLYCPRLAASEIFRVLKPGGLLVGSASFLEAEHFESQSHFSHLGLFRLLENSGLKVINLFPMQSLWELHSGSIYFSLPAHKLLGRLHRRLYLALVKMTGSEPAEKRLLRHAAILGFAAVKPVPAFHD